MDPIEVASMLLRGAACIACLALWRRVRDWQVGLLVIVLTLFTVRPLLYHFFAPSGFGGRPAAWFGADLSTWHGPVLASCNLAFVIFLGRVMGRLEADERRLIRDLAERQRSEAAHRDREARLRLIIETTPECIKVLDAQGRILEMNRAGLAMIEAPSAEVVLGQSAYPIVVAEQRAAFREFNERICRGESGQIEFEIVSLRGTRRTMESQAVPLPAPNGLGFVHLGIARDVTGRKTADRALAERGSRLALLNTIACGITSGMSSRQVIEHTLSQVHESFPAYRVGYATIDASARLDVLLSIEPASSVMLPMTGLSIDLHGAPEYLRALRAKSPLAVRDVAADPRYTGLARSLGESGTRSVVDVPLVHSSELIGLLCFDAADPRDWTDHEVRTLTEIGEYMAIALKEAQSERDRDQALEELRRSLAEQRRLEEQARRQQSELAHVARLSTMGQMVAGIAHEINQPLCAIKNFAAAGTILLNREGAAGVGRLGEWTRQIGEQADRAAAILSRMRSYAGRRPAQLDEIDLNDAVREAAELVAAEARLRRVAVRLELAEPPPCVVADRIEIQQVLVNLLRNAYEAIDPHGGGERKVALVTTIDAGQVRVSVVDSGCGLPKVAVREMFEPFFTTKPQGLGMGLAISRSIVEAHGGRLWAEPNQGAGATFHLTIPGEHKDGLDAA